MFKFFRREKPKVGLGIALGSGGAKGMAHIGALKAFEENGIEFDYIAGASIGSIVGAFYAQGYTADEILHLLETVNFKEITNKIMIKGHRGAGGRNQPLYRRSDVRRIEKALRRRGNRGADGRGNRRERGQRGARPVRVQLLSALLQARGNRRKGVHRRRLFQRGARRPRAADGRGFRRGHRSFCVQKGKGGVLSASFSRKCPSNTAILRKRATAFRTLC